MNPPGLYDGIRITVPGVLLTAIIYLILHEAFAVEAGAAAILAAGVIVGVLLNPISSALDSFFIRGLVEKRAFRRDLAALIRIRMTKLGRECTGVRVWPQTVTDAQVFAAVRAHYSSRHNSPELYAFRSSYAYGHMYFALGLIFTLGSLSAPVVVALPYFMEAYSSVASIPVQSVILSKPGAWQLADGILCLGTIGLLASIFAAKKEIDRALMEELLYWRGASNATIGELRFYSESEAGGLGDKYPSSNPKSRIARTYLWFVRAIAVLDIE